MDQTDREITSLHRFFEISGWEFDPYLINLRCREPADLEYAGQGYQITTGSGRLEGRPGDGNLPDIFLLEILRKKSVRADRNIILLVNVDLPHPVGANRFNEGLKGFAARNRHLLAVWKEVWCVFVSSGTKVRLHPERALRRRGADRISGPFPR